MKKMYVYILTNRSNKVLYTGVTNNLKRRVAEHRAKAKDSFTARYNVDKLVYYEVIEGPWNAIVREKQIKAGSRRRKLDLINAMNPDWTDLSKEWGELPPPPKYDRRQPGRTAHMVHQ